MPAAPPLPSTPPPLLPNNFKKGSQTLNLMPKPLQPMEVSKVI